MYIDGRLDSDKDKIQIVSRINGKRIFSEYLPDYSFYYGDKKGKYQSIFGDQLAKFSCKNKKEFRKELNFHHGKQTFESDINPVFKCLSTHYRNAPNPELNVAMIDIETNFDLERGYSTPEDPFTNITAITVLQMWNDQLITLVMPPDGMTIETAQEICDKFDNTILFTDEGEMLTAFLDLIDDADIISGWNSGGFDLPYLVNRITQVLSKDDTRRFCLWNQYPKERTFEKFGKESKTYDLVGRIHIDYMDLYRKNTFEERHSYALNAIGEYELNETKTQYEGSLDALYKQDFYKFIEYNRQDVALIGKLDKKLKFLELANALAHENTVLLPTTMGVVAMVEQAITNWSHDQNLIVPDRKHNSLNEDEMTAAGAYVADPKKGLHKWIGSVDINSLYPSAIRALNMSPETIVGQVRQTYTNEIMAKRVASGKTYSDAWEGEFGSLEYQAIMNQDKNFEINIDWEHSNKSDTMTAEQAWHLIFASGQKWMISGNGTIFTYEKEGLIPGILAFWYADRKRLQELKKSAIDPIEIDNHDRRQHIKKILLNSLYGALLNSGCKFNDRRIGQSTTLTGRVITKHMTATVNEILAGEYNHKGEAIVYGDTDSGIFSVWPIIKDDVKAGNMEWNKDTAIQLYDAVSKQVNESFPAFMEKAFHCPRKNGDLIKCGREVVGERGLFITKKRYAILVYDLDGKRQDIDGKSGKLKAMGLDLRRSDTPKFVQEFLKEILMEVLEGKDQQDVIDRIKTFKKEFKEMDPWKKGTPKRVNKLLAYTSKEKRDGRANMPGHVRAAMNWNKLREIYSDKHSMEITDGGKTIVCQLRDNPIGMTSVAYPIDQPHLPDWFLTLPFDNEVMEAGIVDKKIENLLATLDNWNDIKHASLNNHDSFDSLFG